MGQKVNPIGFAVITLSSWMPVAIEVPVEIGVYVPVEPAKVYALTCAFAKLNKATVNKVSKIFFIFIAFLVLGL